MNSEYSSSNNTLSKSGGHRKEYDRNAPKGVRAWEIAILHFAL